MKSLNELHGDAVKRINAYKIYYNHYLRVRKSFTDNYLYYLEDYTKRYDRKHALHLLREELKQIRYNLNKYAIFIKRNKNTALHFNRKYQRQQCRNDKL